MSRFVKSKTKKKRKKERARRTYRDSKTSYHDITNPKALKVKWSMGPNPYSSKRVLSQKLCFQRKKKKTKSKLFQSYGFDQSKML